MAVQGEAYIHKTFHAMKKLPQYRTILTTLLKYEIHLLLQQLSDAGEESLLITAGPSDGTRCLLSSQGGEMFMNSVKGVHATIMKVQEELLLFCSTRCFGEKEETDSVMLVHASPDHRSPSVASSMSAPLSHEQCNLPTVIQETEFPSSHIENGNQSDSSIDENVSALVQNIMKCAKEKESQTRLRDMRRRKAQSRRESQSSLNQSASSSDTVKHNLKKCLNQNFDEAEKSVEETVSQLVQNIMKESEEKEKQSMRQSWYNYRRRRRWSPWSRPPGSAQEADSGVGGSKSRRGRRRKTIAECFPELGQHKPLDGVSNSSSNQSVLIKAEPETDYTEYGCVSPTNDADCAASVGSDCHVIGLGLTDGGSVAGEDVETGECSRAGTEEDVGTEEGSKEGCEADRVSVKVELDEDEVELPFVEEFYKNRGEVNGPDLWTTNESQDTQDTDDVKFIMRRLGKSNLVHNGFSYIRDKVGKGNTVYWKCGRFGCKGRVIQRGMEKIRTQDHNHQPVLQFENSVEDEASE